VAAIGQSLTTFCTHTAPDVLAILKATWGPVTKERCR
jgi:hypothetical protein